MAQPGSPNCKLKIPNAANPTDVGLVFASLLVLTCICEIWDLRFDTPQRKVLQESSPSLLSFLNAAPSLATLGVSR